MSSRITSRVAVREAWKREYGKYPMDDPGLSSDRRQADQDVAYMQQLKKQAQALREALAALVRNEAPSQDDTGAIVSRP